ncbi:MAG: acetoin utilization protein AcuC [Armatimonadota bacterium]|nr:MAG: acetoin utilization protein AcuC [Armatimonadota bacterium]
MHKATLIYSPTFAEYKLSDTHPLRPERLTLAFELMQAYGLFSDSGVNSQQPTEAGREFLLKVHAEEYVDIVKALGEGRSVDSPSRYGLDTSDNPIFPGMYEASALCVGGSVLAADLVINGKTEVAFNIGGGLHHAHRNRAAGFCVFNDPAIAIAHILERTDDDARVAYIDIDAHHGDGVQEAFYDSNRVLTISLHETGRYLFPGTGFVEESGIGDGVGYSVNIPLAPYTDDETYLWAFREVVPPLIEAFRPDFILTQLGADTHYRDPLTHLALTTAGYTEVLNTFKRLPGKWVACGGGGYDLEVVPRAWTLAFAVMADLDLPDEIPGAAARHYPDTSGRLRDAEAPESGPELRAGIKVMAERTVQQIKRLIFPRHRL